MPAHVHPVIVQARLPLPAAKPFFKLGDRQQIRAHTQGIERQIDIPSALALNTFRQVGSSSRNVFKSLSSG